MTLYFFQDRNYVKAKGRVLYPEFRGRMVYHIFRKILNSDNSGFYCLDLYFQYH